MTARNEAHDGATKRLREAIAEQDRLTYHHEAALGTAGEAPADAARRGAGEQVTARAAWLQWAEGDRPLG